jgi:predicted AAA+ superfamily ATPase
VDIYITGSNSKLLSSEISTLITAKNIKINVFPLSFAEFYEYSTNELKLNKTDSFNNYFKYGGMPGRLYWDEEIQIWKYLNMIYTDILQHDILNREKINNIKEFSNIYYFLQDNLGKETSIKNIANYLVTNNSSNITAPIVSKYLNLLISCFLLQEISEYDISGKKILVNKNKYYPMDIGLRNSITKNFINNRGKILESIILNELLINNYDVKIGKGRNINEIDFIAVKNSNKIYIQICEYLTEEIRNREINNLLSINDNFPKLILSLDSFNSKDEKGIEYMNIIDWLLLNK